MAFIMTMTVLRWNVSSSVSRLYCVMNFIGRQDCGISIEFDLQQTWNLHLAGLMCCSFYRKCRVQGTIWWMSTWTNWNLQSRDAAIDLRRSGCSDEFTQLAEIIMREKSLQFPSTPEEATTLYVTLLEEIDKI